MLERLLHMVLQRVRKERAVQDMEMPELEARAQFLLLEAKKRGQNLSQEEALLFAKEEIKPYHIIGDINGQSSHESTDSMKVAKLRADALVKQGHLFVTVQWPCYGGVIVYLVGRYRGIVSIAPWDPPNMD